MTIVYERARFYMVWTKQGDAPTVAHNTRKAAVDEAKRLAALHPGQKYIVLQAVEKVSVPADPPMSAQSFGI